jgi:hypothetical protein
MKGKYFLRKSDKEGFWWCLHCERVFVWDGSFNECPYCDGSPLDFSPWGVEGGWGRNWMKENGYPSVPVVGVYYPMYPIG